MIVGIIGLGIIGGSLAKAYKRAGATVYGSDTDKVVLDFAKLAGACDEALDDSNINDCEYILIAIPPRAAVKWLEENMPKLTEKTTVIDCCGIKRIVCDAGFELSKKYGVPYAGSHPMAGRQYSGFKHSAADMYDGAVCAIVPADRNDIREITRLKSFLQLAGFGSFPVMSADEHDKMIAFTSQMTHLISNAFIKSDMAMNKYSYMSGGSFRDVTRVAYLDEKMWTELFMANKDNLLSELNAFLDELSSYRDAITNDDTEILKKLLAEGKKRKIEVDEHAEKIKGGKI